MKRLPRIALLSVLACIALAGTSTAAYGWGPPAKWEAGTCNGNQVEVKSCKYSSPASAFYTHAAGHPSWGLTSFEVAHTGSGESRRPEETLKRIRVDVPPGLAADPQTLPTCTRAEFNAGTCSPATKVGLVELEAFVGPPVNKILTLEGNVYNLEQEPGLPLLFGIEVKGVEVPVVGLVENTKLLLEGHVSYAKEPVLEARGVPSGDFHEWFEINNIPPQVGVKTGPLELVKANLQTLTSKLFFNGHAGKGNFLTLPSECGPPSKSTSYIELEAANHEHPSAATVPPVGVDHCKEVPFTPNTQVTPQASGYDQPDGAVTSVVAPQKEGENEINTADIASGHALFPEGLTLNPSAAHGLEACTPAQMHFEQKEPAACPAGSLVGSVNIETDLPQGSLKGGVYLAAPAGTPITGPPYTVYIVAESVYDVKVKVEATVTPDPSTGRLKVDVVNTAAHPFNLPQLPFSSATLTLNAGPRAPLANPLGCAPTQTESDFIAYSGEEIFKEFKPTFPFSASGCPASIPFVLNQSTSETSNKAGAFTNFTFTLARADGQQSLSSLQTVLPPGLVGLIPTVPLCPEPGAAAGNCPATSRIGTATASAGVGSEPFGFSGPVYLTGPTNGAPYGLSIPIEAAAGPFDLGRVETRVAIGIDSHTARVVTSATLPRIVGGVPLHLRTLGVTIEKPNFLLNPTNCSELHTESLLTSTFNATSPATSAFQVAGCTGLPFKPTFTAATNAKATKLNGASLTVTMTQPASQANLHSVMATLPLQLPSRLTTLQKACLQATFDANPVGCAAAKVGTATAYTPTLPTPLKGSAYLVSHGGAAFPDLDLVLEGSGVRVILVGNTFIKKGITTSTFAAIPDVPVTKFVLELPVGRNSALTAYGSLCAKPLVMPTVMTAQNGAQIKQNTPIAVSGCGVRILSKRVRGHKLVLKVRVPGAGRLTVKAKGLRKVSRRTKKATTLTLKIPLTSAGRASLHRHRPLRVKVRVSFAPSKKGESRSSASASVKFKR